MWVGVGSDHTDRKAETVGVTLSKQLCAKPVGAHAVALRRGQAALGQADAALVRVRTAAARRLYQEGPVTNMRSPEELIRLYTGGDKLAPGTAMFCGTFAVHGGISYDGTFEMELDDPVLGRKLTPRLHASCSLPDEG